MVCWLLYQREAHPLSTVVHSSQLSPYSGQTQQIWPTSGQPERVNAFEYSCSENCIWADLVKLLMSSLWIRSELLGGATLPGTLQLIPRLLGFYDGSDNVQQWPLVLVQNGPKGCGEFFEPLLTRLLWWGKISKQGICLPPNTSQ